jgi:hypothetical protein
LAFKAPQHTLRWYVAVAYLGFTLYPTCQREKVIKWRESLFLFGGQSGEKGIDIYFFFLKIYMYFFFFFFDLVAQARNLGQSFVTLCNEKQKKKNEKNIYVFVKKMYILTQTHSVFSKPELFGNLDRTPLKEASASTTRLYSQYLVLYVHFLVLYILFFVFFSFFFVFFCFFPHFFSKGKE